MSDKIIFYLFIAGVILSFIAGCLVCDSIEKSIRQKKAQRFEMETLRRQNRHLKLVIDAYEAWNLKI